MTEDDTPRNEGIEIMNDLKKEGWEDHWVGMPEFAQEKQEPYAKIIIRVECEEDLQKLSQALGQKLTQKTKSAWFPFKSHFSGVDRKWMDENDAG